MGEAPAPTTCAPTDLRIEGGGEDLRNVRSTARPLRGAEPAPWDCRLVDGPAARPGRFRLKPGCPASPRGGIDGWQATGRALEPEGESIVRVLA